MHSPNQNELDAVSARDTETPDLWRINPWLTAYKIGPMHSQCIDSAEQQRGLVVFASMHSLSEEQHPQLKGDRSIFCY